MKTMIENFMTAYDRLWQQAKEYSRKCQQVYNNIYTS